MDPPEEKEFNERNLMVIGGVEMNMTDYGLLGLQGYQGCLTGGWILICCCKSGCSITVFTFNPTKGSDSATNPAAAACTRSLLHHFTLESDLALIHH